MFNFRFIDRCLIDKTAKIFYAVKGYVIRIVIGVGAVHRGAAQKNQVIALCRHAYVLEAHFCAVFCALIDNVRRNPPLFTVVGYEQGQQIACR